MAKRIVLRVEPKNRGWALTGPQWARDWYQFQVNAIDAGRRTCRELYAGEGRLAQLMVHGRNGRIRFENTYGRDPRRYKG